MDFNQKLKTLGVSNRLPQSLVFVQASLSSPLEKLKEYAEILEKEKVEESLGNAIILDSKDEKSQIKVEEVRTVLKGLSLQNWSRKGRRFILVPKAHLLNSASTNALLKSVEEPPERTHFLFMAPSRKSLLPTLLSRSQILYRSEDSEQLENDVNQASETSSFYDNPFYKSIFLSRSEELLKLSRQDFFLAWEGFKSQLKDVFFEKSYSGEIKRELWFHLFEELEELEQHLESHMDIKWMVNKVEGLASDV